jgi:hypothetical protein
MNGDRIQMPWLRLILALLLSGVAALGSDFRAELGRLQSELEGRPSDASLLLKLGKLCHNESALGQSDAKETEKLASRYLVKLRELQPTNAFARALLGSTRTLGARHAFLPTTKLRMVREGLKEMDAAVEDAPEDPDVRFTRAANNVFLPDLFGRREKVIADFVWLSEKVAAEPARFGDEFRQYVALYHGIAARRYGELDKATRLWQSGLAINPGSKVAELIRLEQTRKPS